MPNRLRFMEALEKGELRPRVECYLLAPKLRMDKDRHRIITLLFSVKMNSIIALACDEKIRRAWEDCETLEREISRVVLNSEAENTDIEFFELGTAKHSAFRLDNVTIEGLCCERSEGQTYLYFAASARLGMKPGLGKFALEQYGNTQFCEFTRSQLQMSVTVVMEKPKTK